MRFAGLLKRSPKVTDELFMDVLGKTGYSPRTLNLEYQGRELFGSLSSPAKVFLFLAMELEEEGPISVGQLYGKRWLEDSSTMEHFRELPDDARTEVLAFVTLMLHEITHHLDFLSTPFGLNFHIKTMREYWSLQDFVPILLENPELIPDRFVDFGDHWDRVRASLPDDFQVPWYSLRERDSEELKKAWDSLRGQILTFEAWGDASSVQPHKRHIERGWAGNAKLLKLFGRELLPVTVHGFLATVTMPDGPSWYLRPLTLLETRAVAHSMQWVVHLLGDDGGDALPSYFARLYRRAGLPDDYFFLFDLLASGWNFPNFEELLQKASLDVRKHVLSLLSAACWYALQAPPPMDQDSLLTSNPIVRLLVVLMAYDDFLAGRNKRSFASFVELANTLDQSTLPQQWGCRPIQDTLGFCRRMVDTIMRLNESKTWNPDMRDHFQHILELLRIQLGRRNDYTSHVGMPEDGNPIFGLDEPEDLQLLDPYEPPKEVESWFNFRNNLLFKYMPRSKVVERMEQHFGMNELFIPCSCGTIISGRVSRYAGRIQTTCPSSSCGRIHNFDPNEIIKINLE
jgi:hypothetical protein